MKNKIFVGLLIIMCLVLTACGSEEKTKKCNDGYILKNDSCVKVDEKDAKISYDCEEGYQLSDDKNSCIKTGETIDAKIDNPCSNGYTYQNSKCVKTITSNVDVTYSCSKGVLQGTKCIINETTNASVSKSCPSGYMKISESASKCVKYTGVSYDTNTGNYYCIYKYYVLNVLDDGRMVCWDSTINTDEIVEYSCSEGTLDGDKCIINTTINANVTYNCSDGFNYENNKCIKIDITEVTGKYYCDTGYELDGTKCTKADKVDSKKTYSCEDDYELVNKKCIKYLDN